ncbi:hypothetical protein SAMN06297382_1212 [Amphiplicatus metriothermophilus]|uniref:Uncharacterized protein n=1 Tax=Amphiplicatus metriothermophilus TaxID=1519374 RepID=A0A239PQI6_9PROT|nr:hypothetical protein [Amphiplicatus metriothermophilus]SNT72176.1 hypothetical protein SAMN06297382_1212 [Amphiplicatus metriothermophilus]
MESAAKQYNKTGRGDAGEAASRDRLMRFCVKARRRRPGLKGAVSLQGVWGEDDC